MDNVFALDKKLFPKDCITLDGRMDEAVWGEAQEFTGFRSLKNIDGSLVPEQAVSKREQVSPHGCAPLQARGLLEPYEGSSYWR